MKKKICLLFLLSFSLAYSALPEPQNSREFLNCAFEIAKNGNLPSLNFLSQATYLPRLNSEQRSNILRRLILTGNWTNLIIFFEFNIIKPRDITDEIIAYAQERSVINLTNQNLLTILLQKNNDYRNQQELRRQRRLQENITTQQEVEIDPQQPASSRKRKSEQDDANPRKKQHIKEPDTCRICLDEYTEDNPPRKMTEKCEHEAHQECFARWCKSAKTDACIFCDNGSEKRQIPEGWMQTIFG